MNAVGQVETVVSGECVPHLRRGALVHSNRLLPERPREAKSSDFLREARNMSFHVKVPQVLHVHHYFKKLFNM